ncbi:Gti1/Pac2 family-domain-containing protein [Sporodiniella umbellata]|nr:Gti1/Pac2 family-domain-containing protein [Sporodiniella umbellata]
MMAETFHGYIETTQDVLLVFEGCRRGLLPRICRRLQERERKLIRSGSIFVFDERESGIKRWTDGRVWSPSRILGNFLIYRELDKKSPGDRRLSASTSGSGRSFSLDGSIDRQKEKQLIGSLSDSYKFKEEGLIKKTMSISVNGVAQHLISYYNPREVLENRLQLPSTVPELASLEISPELLVKQNFRVPPLVEPSFDQNDCELDGHAHNHHPHNFRSMSVGSIRGQEMNEHLPMYPPFQRLDMERSIYGQSPSFSPTIPSSLTPSPSTPMIPQRPPYHHQRHYSTSSAYRSDNEPYQDRSRPMTSHHASMGHIHDTSNNSSNESLYNPATASSIDNSNTRNEERLATPNLVQLLNPVHPLHNNVSSIEYSYYDKQTQQAPSSHHTHPHHSQPQPQPQPQQSQETAHVLQPMEYNYYDKHTHPSLPLPLPLSLQNQNYSRIKTEDYTYDKQQEHRGSIGVINYAPYQPGHPLSNSVENLMFQSTSSFPQGQQQTQDQANLGLINGLK